LKNSPNVPDYIAAELEFASYLIAEQLKTREHGSAPVEQLLFLKKRFFTEHLHRWTSAFFNRVIECSSIGFYQGALMGCQFTHRDHRDTQYLKAV